MTRIAAAFVVFTLLAAAGTARAEDGKAVFAQRCAICHGQDGKAQSPMGQRLGARDLTATRYTEAQVKAAVENGKPPKMMAFKGKLDPAQIDAVSKFVAGGLK